MGTGLQTGSEASGEGARSADADEPATSPEISIVLPVHNGARYLEAALDSIFSQSFADFELIAVDDCSTDETPRILADRAAREPRMRVLTNAANRKLPGSLNIGFRAARGRWLTWTSDDNILHPDMLRELLAATQAMPDADIYYANFRIIDAEGNARSLERVSTPDNLIFRNVVGCCFLYRRAVDSANAGYDEELHGAEDYDFWLRAARNGMRFQPIDRELYFYRRHDESLTDRLSPAILGLVVKLKLREIELCQGPRAARWPISGRRSAILIPLGGSWSGAGSLIIPQPCWGSGASCCAGCDTACGSGSKRRGPEAPCPGRIADIGAAPSP
jgi:glycosyltransferase involved in cell wall biosynthesis